MIISQQKKFSPPSYRPVPLFDSYNTYKYIRIGPEIWKIRTKLLTLKNPKTKINAKTV